MSKSLKDNANGNSDLRLSGRPGKSRKPWPKGCIWPEPIPVGEGIMWDYDMADGLDLDEEGMDLLEIRAYYDGLVEEGVLNDDYSLNEEYEDLEDVMRVIGSTDEDEPIFFPDLGEDYWMDGFDVDMWEEDLTNHLNMLKISMNESDPVAEITAITGYTFVNENLLRQAFTRRAFAVEYGLSGCSEELEFIGDSVLNHAVTQEIVLHMAHTVLDFTDAPFQTKYSEGDFTKIRSQFVSKEYLSGRACETGLDKYILYGSSEVPGESSREDMIEALIGAVAVDSEWDRNAIESVVDRVVRIQIGQPDLLLKETFYELFNSWHQKHFGCMPEYEVGGYGTYWCTLRYQVPENDKGVRTRQRVDVRADTRSKARDRAAELAYRFVTANGLWINLKDAGIEPKLENSINQLQELYQKKYVEDRPEYRFHEGYMDSWECDCECGGVAGYGSGSSKTAAKKKAAYMVIVKLMDAAGICEEAWKDKMYEMM